MPGAAQFAALMLMVKFVPTGVVLVENVLSLGSMYTLGF
jgi:hypothetical protein